MPAPIRKVYGMAGKPPVRASDEQRAGLVALADSRDRSEADRARAVLLTLAGWTSSKIAEAFGVREDTVRLWRSDFTAGGCRSVEDQHRARPASGEE
jgi:Homeodomain-like domain